MSGAALADLDTPASSFAEPPLTTLVLRNGQAAALSQVPHLPFDEFKRTVLVLVSRGAHTVSFFGRPLPEAGLTVKQQLRTGTRLPLQPSLLTPLAELVELRVEWLDGIFRLC